MSLILDDNNILKESNVNKSLDELSEGIQILREYMFFNRFNFLKQCQTYDRFDTGKLSIEKFESALKKSLYKFNDKHISDIVNDAPKTRKNEIMYRQLHFMLSKGEKPKTKISARFMKNHSSSLIIPESPAHVTQEETYESFLGSFFRTKKIYDFENFDLSHLDIKLLQDNNKVYGTQEDIAIKNIYASNNIAIIENFKIQVAQTIFNYLSSSETPITNDYQISQRFLRHLRKKEEEMFSSISELELNKILQKFNLTPTTDEANLLYLLIYREFSENVVNLKCVTEFVKTYQTKRLKQVLNVANLIANMPTKLTKKIEIPTIYQEIIEAIQELGFESIETALNFLESKNAINFEDFKKFLKQYSIGFNYEKFNEFKLWLAQEGILDISNRQNVSEGITFIALDRLLRTLRKTCQDLYIPITIPNKANLTAEEAIINFNKRALQTYWKNIEENVLIVSDSFRMITEMKLREILKNMVYGLDSLTLNTIFDTFKYTESISQDSLQRKIFVDEFFAKVRDIDFTPVQPPKKSEIKATSIGPINFQSRNNMKEDSPVKISSNLVDTDPKNVLGKLERILSELMNSSALKNASLEEKKIPTLPLLKILESYDQEKQGRLEKDRFRQVLIESFPVFNRQEIDVLVGMGIQASSVQNKDLLDTGTTNIEVPYYYFLLQIEKYFELNKLCKQYNT